MNSPLTAEADEHSRFDGWSGACSGTGICDATSGEVTARFVAVDFPVDLKLLGQGTVTVGSEAWAPGSRWLPVDSRHTLTATPAPGWLFVRWEAPCISRPTATSCELFINHPQEATAVFEQGVDFTVAMEGAGEVFAPPPIGHCTGQCSALLSPGTSLTMTAYAAAGSSFTGWRNGCGTALTCRLTVTQPVTVTARFHENIDLTPGGDGLGGVTGVPACATLPCSVAWAPGRSYRLEAVPGENSRFVGFVGCPAVTDAGCTVNQFVPQLQVVFERIITSAIVGDAYDLRDARLVTSAEADFLWMEGAGRMTLGGVQEQDAGPITGDQRWVLFQTRPGPIREVLNLGANATVLSTDRQLDGGMVFVARARTPMTLGAESLLPDDDAIVSTNSTGALEWVLVNRGLDSDVVTLKTDRNSGQSFFVGALRQNAQPVTFGVTTIPPPTRAGPNRLYLAAVDRHGNRQWAARRFDAAGQQVSWPLFALNQGPVLLDWTTATTADGDCLPQWAPFPPVQMANTWSFYSQQRVCNRHGATNVYNTTFGPLRFTGVTDAPDGGLAAVGFLASGSGFWGRQPFNPGPFFAWFEGANDPVPDDFIFSCNIAWTSVASFGSLFLLGGQGNCVPDVPLRWEPSGAVFAVYDRQARRVVRGVQLPFTRLLAVAPIDDREVRALVLVTAPARIGGVSYPALDPSSPTRLLLLTLRP